MLLEVFFCGHFLISQKILGELSIFYCAMIDHFGAYEQNGINPHDYYIVFHNVSLDEYHRAKLT